MVKLRPPLGSETASEGFILADVFVERCLNTSVLFFTRLNEFDLFFPGPLGAEWILACLRATSVSGVLVVFRGLEPFCEVAGMVVAPVVPVM